MAGCQQRQELLDHPTRLVPVRSRPTQVREAEHLALLVLVDHVGVGHPSDRQLPELHVVLGQGAGLVGEDVFDLAELLDQ